MKYIYLDPFLDGACEKGWHLDRFVSCLPNVFVYYIDYLFILNHTVILIIIRIYLNV